MVNIVIKLQDDCPASWKECWHAQVIGVQDTIYTHGYGESIERALGLLIRRYAKKLDIKIKVLNPTSGKLEQLLTI